jgi:hypothetical protein
MINETFDPMFMTYLTETLPDEVPMADKISHRRQFMLKAQEDRLRKIERDGDALVFADPFDDLEHFARERIAKAVRAEIAEPPPAQTQSLPAELDAEELRKALGADEIISPTPAPKAEPSPVGLPRLLDVRSMGREPLPLGPALLDRPAPEVFELVAERAPTARAREFALKMAEQARAFESVP